MDYLSYDVFKQTGRGFEKINTTPYTVVLNPSQTYQLIGTRTLALGVIKLGNENELLISGFSESREFNNKGELVPCIPVENESISIDSNSYRLSFVPTTNITQSDYDCFNSLNVKEVFSCIGFNMKLEPEEVVTEPLPTNRWDVQEPINCSIATNYMIMISDATCGNAEIFIVNPLEVSTENKPIVSEFDITKVSETYLQETIQASGYSIDVVINELPMVQLDESVIPALRMFIFKNKNPIQGYHLRIKSTKNSGNSNVGFLLSESPIEKIIDNEPYPQLKINNRSFIHGIDTFVDVNEFSKYYNIRLSSDLYGCLAPQVNLSNVN